MKKPLCPVCKKKPRRPYAGRFTKFCKNIRCKRLFYYFKYEDLKPKKKQKCQYCKKTFLAPKNGLRKRVTCGSEACLHLSRLKFLKEWKKRNPVLVREQKRRWKQRRREV